MRVLFRTEGDHQQGMGDVWGSLALAARCSKEAAAAGFVVSARTEAAAFIRGKGYPVWEVSTLEEEKDALREFSADAVVVNKLNNPPGYIHWLKSQAAMVVTIDDASAEAQAADLRINALYHADNAVTDVAYLPLREEFALRHGQPKAMKASVEELLITQGGSDTYGFTPRIIRSLATLSIRPHCTVVLGPLFRHDEELKEALVRFPMACTLVRSAENMVELMEQADLAITAGGLTLFELACTGTPSLVVCAERFEQETARRVDAAGACRLLGFGGELDYGCVPLSVDRLSANVRARERMSRLGKALIDGRGCERIMRLIEENFVLPEGRHR